MFVALKCDFAALMGRVVSCKVARLHRTDDAEASIGNEERLSERMKITGTGLEMPSLRNMTVNDAESSLVATLQTTCKGIAEIRKALFDAGHVEQMANVDTLLDVALAEAQRQLALIDGRIAS